MVKIALIKILLNVSTEWYTQHTSILEILFLSLSEKNQYGNTLDTLVTALFQMLCVKLRVTASVATYAYMFAKMHHKF